MIISMELLSEVLGENVVEVGTDPYNISNIRHRLLQSMSMDLRQ